MSRIDESSTEHYPNRRSHIGSGIVSAPVASATSNGSGQRCFTRNDRGDTWRHSRVDRGVNLGHGSRILRHGRRQGDWVSRDGIGAFLHHEVPLRLENLARCANLLDCRYETHRLITLGRISEVLRSSLGLFESSRRLGLAGVGRL